ncbi:hypothetical protein WJX81_003088 [Elliptochloris bilobata]|uniref:Mur ligase C-terminal domain-containing protein n=1 Tax=Elliptochloris bilobata TaxID=381761 RepID=A0AAW1SEI6_9CHLO
MPQLRTVPTPISAGEEVLQQLVDFERTGVPAGAGTDTNRGFDLGRMRKLLARLGNPQDALPVVHVAGSKGKGSVTAMLAAIMHAAGYRVGAYISPHVITLRERISVNSLPISLSAFDALVGGAAEDIGAVQQEEAALSHFEAMTALALRHFQQEQVDIAVVEAGLGGARDATNVFPAPGSDVPRGAGLRLAIITAVGLEHQAALGGGLTKIAAAKAGILKPGVPLVLGRQPEPDAAAALREAAAALGCPVLEPARTVELESRGIELEAGGVREAVALRLLGESAGGEPGAADVLEARLQLVGAHQLDNAAAAVTAALALARDGFPRITHAAILAGLGAAVLPGRFQVVRRAFRGGVQDTLLVLDGAHTPAAAAALAATLRRAFPDAALALVVGMAADKDAAGIMAALRRAAPAPIAGGLARAAAPGKLAAYWQAAGMADARPVRSRELIKASVTAALEAARC